MKIQVKRIDHWGIVAGVIKDLGIAELIDRNIKPNSQPGRIEALLTIMVLSLLIYSIAQRRLRKQLIEQKQTIPDQLKKPISKPTMRWVFQLFEGINLLIVDVDGTQKAFVEGLNQNQAESH